MPPHQSSPFKLKSTVKCSVQFIFCFLRVLRSLNKLLAKTQYFYLPIEILVGNANGIFYFYVQFIDKSDTPKKLKFAKNSSL